MAQTTRTYPGTGSPRVYDVDFDLGYLSRSHIFVYTGDDYTMNQVPFTWVNDTQIECTVATGLEFTVRRITPRDAPINDYEDGAILREKNLDDSFVQTLMILEEVSDGFITVDGDLIINSDLDMGGNRITNLGEPFEDTDAVRLVDLRGTSSISEGVRFFGGDTFVTIRTILPVPDEVSETFSLNMTVLFQLTDRQRTIAATTADGVFALSADLQDLVLVGDTGTQLTTDISALNLPLKTKIDITFDNRWTGTEHEFRLTYDTISTDWITVDALTGDWVDFFGGVNSNESAALTIYNMTYAHQGATISWDWTNLTGIIIPSTIVEYIGDITGTDFQAEDPVTGKDSLRISATNIDFTPGGTGFNPSTTDVDEVLREIDTSFLRIGIIPDADEPNGVPLSPWSTWLVNTQSAPRNRPLPIDPADGVEITIRDDTGHATTNNISIGRNGKTIMGLEENLLMRVGWSWCTIKYFEELDDWRVVQGGVGVNVKVSPSEEIQRMYPIEHVIFSMNQANPADYLGFGAWQRVGEGMFVGSVGTSSDANSVQRNFQPRENAGVWEHTITQAQMPAHSHNISADVWGANNGNSAGELYSLEARVDQQAITTNTVGSSAPLTHRAPTFGMYMWMRVA